MNNKELSDKLDKVISIVCRRIIGRDEVGYVLGVINEIKKEIERLEKKDER